MSFYGQTSDKNMDLLNISSNWLCNKSIKSCLFVRDLEPVISGQTSDSDTKEDIELLLENYENCIQLSEPNDNSDSKSCKLFINTEQNSQSDDGSNKAKVDSFSILCSAKAIEIHGDYKEYVTTLSNEFIDETDGLSMFRNDYQFRQPQEQISLTFKGFSDGLWVYALLININKVKQQKVGPIGGPSMASIMGLMSMFGNSMKGVGSESTQDFKLRNMSKENSLINKFSQLMGPKEGSSFSLRSDNSVQQTDRTNSDDTSKSDVMSSSAQSSDDSKCLSSDKPQNYSPNDDLCECECHRKCVSHSNCSELKELRQYIDNKFSALENSINNKFSSLENKMTTFLSLYLNK